MRCSQNYSSPVSHFLSLDCLLIHVSDRSSFLPSPLSVCLVYWVIKNGVSSFTSFLYLMSLLQKPPHTCTFPICHFGYESDRMHIQNFPEEKQNLWSVVLFGCSWNVGCEFFLVPGLDHLFNGKLSRRCGPREVQRTICRSRTW